MGSAGYYIMISFKSILNMSYTLLVSKKSLEFSTKTVFSFLSISYRSLIKGQILTLNLLIERENSIFCGRRSMYGFYEIDSPSH